MAVCALLAIRSQMAVGRRRQLPLCIWQNQCLLWVFCAPMTHSCSNPCYSSYYFSSAVGVLLCSLWNKSVLTTLGFLCKQAIHFQTFSLECQLQCATVVTDCRIISVSYLPPVLSQEMRISPSWGHSALMALYEKKSGFFVKKMEQLNPPESLSLEEILTETWKWQLEYFLKLLKANGNEDQLERMRSSTWLYVPSIFVQIVWL